MPFEVLFSKAAEKDIEKIPLKERVKIYNSIDGLRRFPSVSNIKKLKPTKFFRLRVGNYRVRFEVLQKERALLILSIKHRKEAYGDL